VIGARTYRGQPLVALCLILGGWVAMRAMVFDAAAFAPIEHAVELGGSMAGKDELPRPVARTAGALVAPASQRADAAPAPALPAWNREPVPAQPRSAIHPAASTNALPDPLVAAHTSSGHLMMWLSAMAQLPLPAEIFIPPANPPADAPLPRAAKSFRVEPRWSGDGWLLLRGGRTGMAEGAPLASYGASQAGAVIRYRLAPSSAHRPDAYLRASTAIGHRDREVAAGLALRPLARLPVVVAAEARVSDLRGGLRVRPAAFAYTELPPVAFPEGLRGEGFAQAGYVGGAFSTAFVDAQARVDRKLLRIGSAELRAGGGAWGGAQKGASRVDVGPVASVGLAVGERAAARLDLDWRFRIAGRASPASGPALTLSAGF
jgi:hypothetical protein